MQAQAAGGMKSFICSTMPEVWQLVQSGLVEESLVNDVRSSLIQFWSVSVNADLL